MLKMVSIICKLQEHKEMKYGCSFPVSIWLAPSIWCGWSENLRKVLYYWIMVIIIMFISESYNNMKNVRNPSWLTMPLGYHNISNSFRARSIRFQSLLKKRAQCSCNNVWCICFYQVSKMRLVKQTQSASNCYTNNEY